MCAIKETNHDAQDETKSQNHKPFRMHFPRFSIQKKAQNGSKMALKRRQKDKKILKRLQKGSKGSKRLNKGSKRAL